MASVFGTALETGGNGEIEKALRKIVKDEVRKEQFKYGKHFTSYRNWLD